MYSKDIYLVAAGKYYREYFDERDPEVQYSAVSILIICMHLLLMYNIYTISHIRSVIYSFQQDTKVKFLSMKQILQS